VNTDIKICGIKTPEALSAAYEGGARYVGFVFYPSSVRYLQPAQARELALRVPTGVKTVGLFVNASDHDLQQILGTVPLDILQLHGDETPQRVGEIRTRFEMPVMKAIPVANVYDIAAAKSYEDSADWLLFDTKAPAGEYGGTGQSFDWSLLAGQSFKKPWMLSGGLSAENVHQALKTLKPAAVDVSSGVESARGIKDADKIKAFIAAVKAV
jgi:phosphoribosylanthranilate isomerase